jgi:hypothetical protein
MTITLNGLGPTITPDSLTGSSIPFTGLSFSGLTGTTNYTLTVTISSGALFSALNYGAQTGSSVTITDLGSNLASDLHTVTFALGLLWELHGPATLSFAMTSPSAQSFGTEQVYCLTAGTLIRTPHGDVPVETLRKGDRVVTARDGGRIAPVRWVGHRRVAPARHPRPWDVNPIRIRADAFGPGEPRRDVRLSPDHAVFVDGILIRARDLLNGATIVQEEVDEVAYHHIELDIHDVLLADGLPVESFLDTGNRGAFANGGVPVAVHPDFSRAVWASESCARLVWEGPQVAAVRQRLAAVAEDLGWVLTERPEVCVLADGVEIRPDVVGGLGFDLPPGTGEIRVRSRACVPAYVMPGSIDTRILGVAVTRVWLDGVALALDGANFGAGWVAAEAGLRWTQGDAVLRVGGARRLDLRLADLLRYWVPPASSRDRPADLLAA